MDLEFMILIGKVLSIITKQSNFYEKKHDISFYSMKLKIFFKIALYIVLPLLEG